MDFDCEENQSVIMCSNPTLVNISENVHEGSELECPIVVHTAHATYPQHPWFESGKAPLLYVIPISLSPCFLSTSMPLSLYVTVY